MKFTTQPLASSEKRDKKVIPLGKIRKILREQRTISQNTDDHYGLDRHRVDSYFDLAPEWSEKIVAYFEKLHEKGERAVHLDICGRAMASRLGADKTFSFSLKPENNFFSKENSDSVEYVSGDIFNALDFAKFLNHVKQSGDLPSLVTFVPVAGLQSYTPKNNEEKAIVYQQLEDRLRDVIKILQPGGYIFLDRPFQFVDMDEHVLRVPLENQRLPVQLREIAADIGLEINMIDTMDGPQFLLRKRPQRKKILRSHHT